MEDGQLLMKHVQVTMILLTTSWLVIDFWWKRLELKSSHRSPGKLTLLESLKVMLDLREIWVLMPCFSQEWIPKRKSKKSMKKTRFQFGDQLRRISVPRKTYWQLWCPKSKVSIAGLKVLLLTKITRILLASIRAIKRHLMLQRKWNT